MSQQCRSAISVLCIVSAVFGAGIAIQKLLGVQTPDETAAEARHVAVDHIKHLGGTVVRGPAPTTEALNKGWAAAPVVMVYLANTQVTRGDLRHLAVLNELERLTLDNTQLGPGDTQFLAKLRSLRSLSLAGTKVSDEDMANLNALPGLVTLSLRGTPISDDGVVHLTKLSLLQNLDITETNVSCDGIRLLKSFPDLRGIDIDEACVTSETIAELKALPRLKMLRVHIPHGLGKPTRELLMASGLDAQAIAGRRRTPFWDTRSNWDETIAGAIERVASVGQFDERGSEELIRVLTSMGVGEVWLRRIPPPSEFGIPAAHLARGEIQSFDEFLAACQIPAYPIGPLHRFACLRVTDEDVPQLLQAVRNADLEESTVRFIFNPLFVLARKAATAPAVAAYLVSRLESDNPQVRCEVIRAFAERGLARNTRNRGKLDFPSATFAARLLRDKLDDPEVSVRNAARAVFAEIAGRNVQIAEEVEPLIVDMVASSDALVRGTAIEALRRIAVSRPDLVAPSIPKLRQLIDHQSPSVRASAVEALGAVACADRETQESVVPLCFQLLADQDTSIRRSSGRALARLAAGGDPHMVQRVLSELQKFMRNTNPVGERSANDAFRYVVVAIRDGSPGSVQ